MFVIVAVDDLSGGVKLYISLIKWCITIVGIGLVVVAGLVKKQDDDDLDF